MPANKSNRIRLENSSEINEKLQTVEIGGEASPVGISKNAVKLQSNKSFVIGNSVQLIDNSETQVLTAKGSIDILGSLTVDGEVVITESSDVDSLNDLSDVTYSSGGLTITSLDKIISGALEFDCSGDITLSADGGDINFTDGTDTVLNFDTDNNEFQLFYDGTNYFKIAVAADGASEIRTQDAGLGAEADLLITADGDVTFNSTTAQHIYKFTNTERGRITYADSRFSFDGALNTPIQLKSSGTGDIYINPSAGTILDKNTSGDSAEDATAFHIDYDRAVATSGTAAHNDIGVDLDVNSASLGTSTVTGMDVDVVGATSGTHTATGIDLNVSGSDDNVGIKITSPTKHIMLHAAADAANDFSSIAVADTGDLVISTSGDGTTDSDLLLDVDGAITLDAANTASLKGIQFAAAGTTFANFDMHHGTSFLTLFEAGGASMVDYFQVVCESKGATTLATVDAAGSDAFLKLDADGDIFLEPQDGGIKIRERLAATTDTAAYGQLWVRGDTPNTLWFTTDAGDDVQLTTTGGSATGEIQVATVTISEAEMNALHTTEKVLVAAQGAGKVIIPQKVVFFVDRDASTVQSAAANLHIGIDGSTTSLAGTWGYLKRFMYNESGDRILQMHQGQSDEIAQTAAYGDNQPLTAKTTIAITSGSIDSCKVVVSYYVYDNS